MDIKFKGNYDKKEYFQPIYLAGKPTRRSTLWRVILFVAFTGIYIALVIHVLQDSDPSAHDQFRLIRHFFTILLLAYFIFLPYIRIYTTASRLWRDPLVRRALHGTISNQGISYGTHTLAWEEILTRREQEDMVVLLTNDRTMALLPRHFFQSSEDWNHFRQLVDHKVVEAR